MKKLVFSAALATSLLFSSTQLTFANFNDVPTSHSNYSDIQYLLDKGVIEDGTRFGVKEIVTRAEVAVMIAKALDLDGTQRNTIFNDVPKSNKNSGYIQSAVDYGIIKGYDDGTFKPNTKVTRGHMATFIARAFNLPNGNKTFKDVKKGNTAFEAVSQLAAAGITNGYEDNTFKPNANLTRAHISAFLARAIKYEESNFEEEKEVVKPTPEVTPTPAPSKGKGETRNTAVKIGETVSINIDDWLDGKQKFDLTLTQVIDGDQAWNMIKEENMFNEEPDTGMKYVLAKFKIKIDSLEEEPFDINHAHFDAVSNAGAMYNEYVTLVTPAPNLRTELYSGSKYEGWTYFMVKENDTPKVVYRSGFDSERWFDLGL